MQPDERDAGYLWDMVSAAREVTSFTHGIAFEAYRHDRMRQRAVERAIEIVGEAARFISDAFKAAHPEIPWRPIIAQRHVLAHEYGEISQERIWRVATHYMPVLLSQLETLLPPLPPDMEGPPA